MTYELARQLRELGIDCPPSKLLPSSVFNDLRKFPNFIIRAEGPNSVAITTP